MRRDLAVGVVALAAVVGAACGGPAPAADPEAVEGPRAGESIDWAPCSAGVECGFVEVPADYRSADAGTLRIAVNIHRATAPEERIGYLLVNPGGPGESGVELVHGAPSGQFTGEVASRFDIVGFDPRGVGGSEPAFACGEPGEQLALLAAVDGPIDTADEVAAGEAAAALCTGSMGPVGGLLHSEYVARDMDRIRQALGAEQISYLGFSYGSALGVWYATLFPDRVRAMVVDGADNPVKPTGTAKERIGEQLEQAATFADFLDQALSACDGHRCPIYNDGDPAGYFLAAAEKLGLVGDAANHPQAGALGVISTLYSEQTWPDLWAGLFELHENGDPSILAGFAGLQLGPEPGAASFTAHVNCLDAWALHPEVHRDTQLGDAAAADAAISTDFPLLAALDAFDPDACPFYDQFAPDPLEGPLDGGGAPILVVANHGDPFTSFHQSEELATQTLTNGYLVETAHPKHVVYPDNACVNGHIHRALIEQSYPSGRRALCETGG